MTVSTNDPKLSQKMDPKFRHFCFLVHEVFAVNLQGRELWETLITILDVQVKADEELAINVGKQNYVRWLKDCIKIYKQLRETHGRDDNSGSISSTTT